MTAGSTGTARQAVDGVRDLTLAMMRWSWAGALLGADRMADLLRAGRVRDSASAQPAGRTAELPDWGGTLNAVTTEALRRMDVVTQAVFLAGDDLQEEWLDGLPPGLDAASLRRSATRFAADAAASLQVMGPGRDGTATRLELFHKSQVYLLVRRASRTGARARSLRGFEELLRRVCELQPRHAPWVLEGLSHGYVASQLATLPPDAAPEGLLTDAEIPASSLVMVHLGLGMALGEHVFAGIRRDDAVGVRRAVSRYIGLCRANAAPGEFDASVESLGLVLRCFFPDLVPAVGRTVRSFDTEELPLSDYFWHGVGRAIYFLPLHLLPGYGTIHASLRRLERETPGPSSGAHGRSGIACAATMVNLGQPLVLERFVVRHPEAVDRHFIEGVASSVRLRLTTTPESDEVDELFAHEPSSAKDRDLWRRHLLDPLSLAVDGDGQGGTVYRRLTGARA